jgi:hypothetical protein
MIVPLAFGEEVKYSGEVAFEYRYFEKDSQYNDENKSDPSIVLKPEASYSWDSDRKVVSFIPFYRINSLDDQREHGDIRELSFVGAWDTIELRAGISKVYWGVTENQHLVDIVNQTDFVESISFEEKLGQPMVNVTYITDYGNFDYFLLPLFRERTFPGEDGRFRAALIIDTDNPVYEDEQKERHIDHAFRWSHYYESFEWAFSYFKGTDREPIFQFNNAGTKIIPYYRQVEQYGLELQYNYESWLLKTEAVRRVDQFNEYFLAYTTGFEYTFSNIHEGMDIGILYELNRDGRAQDSPIGLDQTSFVGSRVALNDEDSAEFLAGVILNNRKNDLISFRFEGSRRINQNWKGEIEFNIIQDPPEASVFKQVEDDDYIQLALSYFY